MGFELPSLPKGATEKDKDIYKQTLLRMLPKDEILKLISKEYENKKLIKRAHDEITRKKGKDYSPDVHELQKWIDNHLSKLPKKDVLRGGLSDNMSLYDIALKHTPNKSDNGKTNRLLKLLKTQLKKGITVEMEHIKDEDIAREIAMDHLYEDPNYYDKLSKVEKDTKESTGADSAGAFEPAFGSTPVKRKIGVIHNLKEDEEMKEATDASSSGAYDVPFGDGGKNPLKIGGPESIKKSRAVKDKNFPKWGGPKGVYVKVKEKCKKFPYCNQGNTGAIEFYEVDGLVESIKEVSKEKGIPYSELEKLVLNEISKIFIK